MLFPSRYLTQVNIKKRKTTHRHYSFALSLFPFGRDIDGRVSRTDKKEEERRGGEENDASFLD